MKDSTTDSRSSGLGMHLFVGGMLLLALLGAVLFVPLLPCPACEVMSGKKGSTVVVHPGCVACGGKGRLGLHKRWQEIQALRSNGIDNVPLFP